MAELSGDEGLGDAVSGQRGRQERDQKREREQAAAPDVRLPKVPGFAAWPAQGSPKREGKALRKRVARSAHGQFEESAGRPDPVAAVEESNRSRLPELAPIRVGRMTASPFAFLRGAAGLMAYDLAQGPLTGIGAQICGDAHAANFGLYGDARGGLVMDLNDFDETVHGPWEWDLKRLVTSLVLAGRAAGAGEGARAGAALDAPGAHPPTMRPLPQPPGPGAWDALPGEELGPHTDARDLPGPLGRGSPEAPQNTRAPV
ncbi:DUF2252 family protein, partial [Streptomyces sp. G44]|uniref:DUF2252 family protein n=1 Tax=Streptomyces sp. G44 TaxID=2807632 RepID=UPI00195F8667